MRNAAKMAGLAIMAGGFCAIYLFQDLNGSFDYALPRRTLKVLAMVITGFSIAYATVVFQTITHNRILTPNIMGLDSLYLLLQTVIIFFLGSGHTLVVNKQLNFLITVAIMITFALLLYQFLFKKGNQPIYFLLLVGIILGTFFSSFSTFFQVLIDPNEFQIVQDRMFASFNNIHSNLVWLALVIVTIVVIYSWHLLKYLDVIALGRETAINLGVPYEKIVKRMLVIGAIFISISTALVGPITFFGLITANLAYQFFKTYKHRTLICGAIVISIVFLVGGQWVVERVFRFSTTLSVMINFIGGVYFIYLLLKERKAA